MEPLTFSYDKFKDIQLEHPDYFDMLSTLDQQKYVSLKGNYYKRHNIYGNVLDELKKRTTGDYYNKVKIVQEAAVSYSGKVFPPYELYMPETIVDDWLSMVDWHKEHSTRDHSLHQTLTTYIVQSLLGFGNSDDSLELGNGKKLLEYAAEILLRKESVILNKDILENEVYKSFSEDDKIYWAERIIFETATIAALFHDMGYPWQFIERLSSHLSFSGIDEICRYAIDGTKCKKELEGRLLSLPFYGYKKSNSELNDFNDNIVELMKAAFQKTHGFPGAVCFQKLNENIRIEVNDNEELKLISNRLILEWAAVAIMMHDMEGLYRMHGKKCFQLNFEKDPVSCLIAMSDVLEEFQRPSVDFDNQPESVWGKDTPHVDLFYNFKCLETKISFNGERMVIEDKYTDEPKSIDHRKKELEHYFNQDGFINLSSWGITGIDYSYSVSPSNEGQEDV